MISFMLGEITTKSFTINYYLYHGAEKKANGFRLFLFKTSQASPYTLLIEPNSMQNNIRVLMAWSFGISR